MMDRAQPKFHDQQPACAFLQCSNTPGPPSPLHQHLLSWLKQHKGSRAAVQLHSCIQCVYPGNWRVSAVAKSNTSLNSTHTCSSATQLKSSSADHPRLSFANGMNKEKHSRYDHGITRCRQYLLAENGCPFLLEIKKRLLMLQTANPHPLIMSAKILIISH